MSLSVMGRHSTVATTASWAAAPPRPIWLATTTSSENNNACTTGASPACCGRPTREPQETKTPAVELAHARLMVLCDRLTQNPPLRCQGRVHVDNGGQRPCAPPARERPRGRTTGC